MTKEIKKVTKKTQGKKIEEKEIKEVLTKPFIPHPGVDYFKNKEKLAEPIVNEDIVVSVLNTSLDTYLIKSDLPREDLRKNLKKWVANDIVEGFELVSLESKHINSSSKGVIEYADEKRTQSIGRCHYHDTQQEADEADEPRFLLDGVFSVDWRLAFEDDEE